MQCARDTKCWVTITENLRTGFPFSNVFYIIIFDTVTFKSGNMLLYVGWFTLHKVQIASL